MPVTPENTIQKLSTEEPVNFPGFTLQETFYLQNLHNGLLKSYSPVTDGTRKSHEMPVFRDAYNDFSQNVDAEKVIFVLDRAYSDHTWCMYRMRAAIL